MASPRIPRLAIAPLEAHLLERLGRRGCQDIGARDPNLATLAELAELCDVVPEVYRRWRKAGVNIFKADRLACSLGRHPATIWGQDWWTTESSSSCDTVAA